MEFRFREASLNFSPSSVANARTVPAGAAVRELGVQDGPDLDSSVRRFRPARVLHHRFVRVEARRH
jgi:hypothetical protein